MASRRARRARKTARHASFLSSLTGALSAVSTWLADADVDFAIVGGVAASLHGRPRLTKDVDVVALCEDEDWTRLVRLAAQHQIRPRFRDALELTRTTRVLLLVHVPSSIEIDVSFGMLPFEEELVRRAKVRVIGPLRLRIATAEDIVIMKALALRSRDIADIEGILESVEKLDLRRVRRVVTQLSAALETVDHAEELERALKRARKRGGTRN